MNLLKRLVQIVLPAHRFSIRANLSLLATFAMVPMIAFAAEQKIPCDGDGTHNRIDLDQLTLKYQATEWDSRLAALSKLAGVLKAEPKTLQVATEATQKWNEFLKALVLGYNSCAITKAQYNDAIKTLIPGLAGDSQKLETLAHRIEAGQQVSQSTLDARLAAYVNKLEKLDQINRTTIVHDLKKDIAKAKVEIIQNQERGKTELKGDIRGVSGQIAELKDMLSKSPLATPQEVKTEISELKKNMLAKVDEAELAYDRGYKLIGEYRFDEAVSYFQQALAILKLPEFYLALGHAYSEIPLPGEAEQALRDGLKLADEEGKEQQQAALSNDLGLVLKDKGDLDGAQRYAERALKINEKVYGLEHPSVRSVSMGLRHLCELI